LTRISTDNRDYFLPTDIGRKQCSPSEMQKESQSIDQASKAPQPPWLEKPVRITEQVWPEGTVPVVSIRCITYQHVNFIREAIEGFLMQETTFPVEVLIHDDASTDGTADIVREYQAKYPQLIRTVLQTENQWSKGRAAWRQARRSFDELVRGQFIAICEGDDYWTSPHKLQKQFDVLEKHPEASGCFHVAEVRSSTGESFDSLPPIHIRRDRVLADVWFNFWLPTCSLVFRRGWGLCDMAWSAHLPMGDAPLLAELCNRGPIKCLNESLAVYRKHGGGVWTSSTRTKQLEDMLSLQLALRTRFKDRNFPPLNQSIKNLYASLFGVCVEEGRRRVATKHLFSYLTCRPLRGTILSSQKRNLLRYLLPLPLFRLPQDPSRTPK
jgi:glycosyltransferase involved in cell wall biosynthesis